MTTTTHRPPMVIPVVPADWVPGPKQGEWTYNDYANLPDDGHRYEIVNGVLLLMSAPSIVHQRIAGRFFRYLAIHVEDAGLGVVLEAPTDVELTPDTVFQPDVLVVLNAGLHKVAEFRIIGAPDLVVEVASPSTAVYDRLTKYEKYAHTGVPEYWMVNPERRIVEVMVLEHGEYRSLGVFQGQQTLPSRVIPGFPVQVEQFFASIV